MKTTEWQEVLDLVGPVECLWQDWQGFHLEAIPEHAPPTSVLWGWRQENDKVYTVRIRIDIDRINSTPPARMHGTFHVANAKVDRAASRQTLMAWDGLGQARAARAHAIDNNHPDPTRITIQRNEPNIPEGSLASFLWAQADPAHAAATPT